MAGLMSGWFIYLLIPLYRMDITQMASIFLIYLVDGMYVTGETELAGA
jgi:hypothetical protein